MTFFKLSALALATTLALTGCGDDDDNDSGTGGVITDPTLSELDQAKEMVRTAKLFVSDNYAVEAAYEDTADLLTEEQSNRFNYVFNIPDDLYTYMLDKDLSELTGAQIIALADDAEFNGVLTNFKLSPESDFVATVDNNEHLELNGTTRVTVEEVDYIYNPTTNNYEETVIYADNFDIKFNGYEDNTASLTSSTNHEGNISFDSIEYGTGDNTVKLTAGNDGVKAVGNFSKAVTLDDTIGLDLDELEEQGITLESIEYTLDSLKMEANDAVIEAKDFEFKSLNIQNTMNDGTVINRQLPYSIKLTGDIEKDSPKTEAAITLNMIADEDDVKNYITLDNEDDFVEADSKYVDMTALLSVKGDVTKEGATTIPLDFQANLERTARDVVALKNLTASVEGKTLYVTGQTNLDDNYDATGSTLTVKQNDAYITLNVNSDGDFITDANNKLGDIMVGDEDFGDLFDNDGQVTAIFSDDSTIIL